ncbi:unnamed protein product, partial [Brugia timori]|uniref:AGC-kinase C-terminal domain-containing protein n=1 Tax=Brugia timori TaxID=42155 RepID=A0A0R3QBG4_9BILA
MGWKDVLRASSIISSIMPSKTDGASNGTAERSFVNFDPEDPEYIKELQRP